MYSRALSFLSIFITSRDIFTCSLRNESKRKSSGFFRSASNVTVDERTSHPALLRCTPRQRLNPVKVDQWQRMAPIILYDLVTKPGGPFWAPNPWKTRLSLLHKGVEFKTQEISMADLKALAKEEGVDRITVPSIKTPEGKLIVDSWLIAEWLDQTYSDAPSLFLPASKTPVDLTSPEYEVAKNFAWLMTEGFGSSDAQWSTFFELSMEALGDMHPGNDSDKSTEKGWFKSDEKLGIKDGWKTLTSSNKPALLAQAKASLTPLESLLSKPGMLYLTSKSEPGFVDYVAYGRYMMMRIAVPELADQVWGEKQKISEWIQRLENKFENGPGGEGLAVALKRK